MPDHAPAPAGRRIALIAHDNKKLRDMLEWAEYNLDLLAGHRATADFMISSPLLSRLHQQWDPAATPGLSPGRRSPDDQDRAVGEVDDLVRRAAEDEPGQVTAAA